VELTNANSELERSLEENARMRGYLTRVLENLPCGVLVAGADGVQIMNPEARRLLHVPADWAANAPKEDGGLPPEFAAAIARIPAGSFFCEQEISIAGTAGDRSIGISRANISEPSGVSADT